MKPLIKLHYDQYFNIFNFVLIKIRKINEVINHIIYIRLLAQLIYDFFFIDAFAEIFCIWLSVFFEPFQIY